MATIISESVGELMESCNADATRLLLSFAKENYRNSHSLSAEHVKFRGSVRWSFVNHQWVTVMDFALVLDAYLDTEGYWQEDKHNLELGLEVVEHLANEYLKHKALLLHNLAVIYAAQADHRRAQTYFEESLVIEQELDDKLSIARTLNYLA